MLVNGERPLNQCPVSSQFGDTSWGSQCPVVGQWNVQPPDVCFSGYNQNYVGTTVPCYRNVYEHVSYYHQVPYQTPVQYARQTVIPNLPCHQEQWNYNNMCYDVDGQPCQYAGVIDLEDFMNNEKRKEKSRVAARCRRTKEMQIFTELTAALPARKEEVEQLDKASVMRLAISYLRVRDVVSKLPIDAAEQQTPNPKGLEEVSSELSYMKALDGFVLVISQQGDIVYCSENISDHLGVSQMEIMGQSVFEFSHPCDHEEVREALRSSNGRRELLLRLKCTLTSKGRNVHLKSASYKVIHITGHMLTQKVKTEEKNNNNENGSDDKRADRAGSLIAVGRPIPHPANIQTPLDTMTFLSRHSLDMKFTYTYPDALMNTLGFQPDELAGKSLYDYHHAADSAGLAHQFKSLFSKGQCETGQYRFLAKSGGYAWVQTQATVINDKQQKPVSVVCVNYIISGIECKDEVFATHQVQDVDLKPNVGPTSVTASTLLSEPICVSIEEPSTPVVALIAPDEERPIPVTELIFAPRKKEMNKGFLMFSPDEGHTMLKDEPEDLTHLAPTAGDTCIPLENSPFDMFDEFMLNDNYCSLLGDDLTNASPVDSLTPESFLLSSPEPQETESSCEQSSLLTELSLDAFDSGRSDNDIDDGHSPFIPMNDERPVLEPAVMWGALPDNVSQARPQPSEMQPVTGAPALQQLLAAPTTGPPPQDLITNIYSDQGLIPCRSMPSWDTGVKRVMKQEEEPSAKRAKRSPSPATTTSPKQQSSSVLMNLLPMDGRVPPEMMQQNNNTPSYQLVMNQKTSPHRILNCNTLPIPVINIHTVSNSKVAMLPNNSIQNSAIDTHMTSNISCPLSVNVNSPIYSLPSSPNNSIYSPAISPAQRDLGLSPYSTPQSLSPIGKFNQIYSPSKLVSPGGVLNGGDPYLSNKVQTSPGFPYQARDLLLDSNVSISSPDFWTDADILSGTNDLLTAFDDVKL
ncbi:unnamed protein product [Diatraea saccharalis]|uniref:Uncharacterized protein n=1 Tax=Diatraea saccharalis TaxID=40085 RepID=A0A9N9WDZ3_9NEOP|nr:unnamed protein product [Diatraea saccharalis]